ncbi:hypothetical protein DPMN_032045 [Dreissena polymorpha]|uniref:Uncharacterized protein n=1 Tax=Dreissena polymorpha TaxID=45954 RepID=A0A9D4RJW4_DREPO|nr:hypothetical protein DPMN_032045 [Dreissena polymorpha]
MIVGVNYSHVFDRIRTVSCELSKKQRLTDRNICIDVPLLNKLRYVMKPLYGVLRRAKGDWKSIKLSSYKTAKDTVMNRL